MRYPVHKSTIDLRIIRSRLADKIRNKYRISGKEISKHKAAYGSGARIFSFQARVNNSSRAREDLRSVLCGFYFAGQTWQAKIPTGQKKGGFFSPPALVMRDSSEKRPRIPTGILCCTVRQTAKQKTFY